jgi:ABC-type multidrug transport system permease subunit
MWDSFVAILRKEFTHILRDRRTLMVAMTIPLFQLMLFGFIDQTVQNLPTVVVDQDQSADSRELMDKLRATHTFRVRTVTTNPLDARSEIAAGRARLVIPPDYHDKRARNQPAKVLVLIDGSDSTVSAQALAAVSGLAAQDIADVIARAGATAAQGSLAIQPIILFNPDGRTANYIIPGLIAIILMMVATILTTVAIVKEREQGTFEQLLVTPVHPVGLMLGKVAPYLLVGIAEMVLILLAMRFGFSVPIRGSLVFLFGMAIVYLFALLSLGLFLSTLATTQAEATQLAQFFMLPSFMLSGYIFPTAGLPPVLYAIGYMLPATHMIEIMRGVVLREAGPLEMLPHVLALAAMSVILVTLSVRRFQRVTA